MLTVDGVLLTERILKGQMYADSDSSLVVFVVVRLPGA